MATYTAIFISSDGKKSEKTIESQTLRGAKSIASRIFPTRGRWQKCLSFDATTREWYYNNQHLKTDDILKDSRLYLMPIENKGTIQ